MMQSLYQKQYETLYGYCERLKNYARHIEICGESRNSYSKTDNDATFMRVKSDYMGNDQLLPAYNLQAAVCDEYIAVIDAKPYASDMECFVPLMEKYMKFTMFDKETNRPAYNSTSDYIAPLEKSEDIWKCAKCGRYNSGYACECGILKGDSALLEKQQAERNRQKSEEKVKSDKEVENLQKLKAYKDLLDSGVISQEEFDKKKMELLNL